MNRAKRYAALPVAAAFVLVAASLAIAPRPSIVSANTAGAAKRIDFSRVAPILARRCAVCHAAHPREPGFPTAPLGVLLDTPQRIAANAARIRQLAVISHRMPLGNVTDMTEAERLLLGHWIDQGAHT